MSSTETFQHYQVLKKPDGAFWELGRGAMGVTYKAFDTSLRCHVALKVINNNYLDSEMAAQRFLREARAAAGLSHPNVASVFHLGQEGGNYFYAMEFINGETVEALVRRRGPLPSLTAMRITLQVARALRAASRVGLVHRDIKPANLMLVREDEEDTGDDELHVKVIDFGLAKIVRREGADMSATITVAGFVGTPHFASPEQLEEKDLDARSDIYSLGITLWYMLTGKPPFSGSMVQIMSQHLTRRPPFDNLKDAGAPVVKVLERMLEKDPARRQQTPSELRREIEAAIHALENVFAASTVIEGMAPGEGGAPMLTEIVTTAGSAIPGNVTARLPEPGVVLDGRYRLTRRVSQSERGVLFQAAELDSQKVVAVKILSTEMLADARAYEKAREDYLRANEAKDPALLELYAFIRTGAQTFVAYEWVNGFSLVEVLRQRSVLTGQEVLDLLGPVAAALDHLKSLGVDPPEIDATRILLSLADSPAAERADLPAQPFTKWPPFQPKIFPLRLHAEAGSSATWAGQQTIVPVRKAAPTSAVSLALLAYELLGGNAGQFHASRRYSPLPSIGEAGNGVLRDVLLEEENAPAETAERFVEVLAGAVRGTGVVESPHRPPTTVPPAAQPSAPSVTPVPAAGGTAPPASVSPTVPPPGAVPAPGPAPTPAPALLPPIEPPRRVSVAALLGGFAIAAVLLWALTYFGFKAVLDRTRTNLAASPTPAPTATPRPLTPTPTSPAVTPAATPLVAYDTPVPSMPPPSTPVLRASATPVATPLATPSPPATSRADRLASALQEARRLQDNRQTADAFAAYVRIAEEFPESDEGLARIDSYVSDLRASPLGEDLEKRRFQQMRPLLERAARLGSDVAMLYLGEHLRTTEPADAADWFREAAAKGQPEAMVALGDMYYYGVGVNLDPGQSAHWYQLASDKGYAKGKLNLAECYQRGKGGVQRDFQKSFELVNEALSLEPNNPQALEMLALDHEAGRGTPVNVQQAFALMKRASDAGNANATGNLGAYYMRGFGTPKNPQKAVALFKAGADRNNASCMFFYAQCLEGGLGGLAANKAEAAGYYRASAERNFPPAKEYCLRNNIRFAAPK